MREIKFRGKRLNRHGDWVYGSLVYRPESGVTPDIFDWTTKQYYPVDPESVGQLTGRKDKGGKEIYEGDIVKAIAEPDYPDSSITSDVIFGDTLQFQIRNKSEYDTEFEYLSGLPLTWGGWESLEVIGNIYENPELIK